MRALIATIPPERGGVPAMLRATLRLLAERGIESEVAWYEPYRMTPRLSVPSWRLGTRRVASERREVPGAAAGWAIGAWLPELEFEHYRPTRPWRERIAAADLHLVVSGSCLAGRAFLDTGTPFLAWVASDWEGDRRARVRRFPAARRLFDRTVVAASCRRLERRILRAGRILALSEATRRALDRAAGEPVTRARLAAPIDVERFRPDPDRVVPGRVGLVGRFDDPRKNVGLFLAALAQARRGGVAATGMLVGADAGPAERREIERLGLAGAVEVAGDLGADAYTERLQSLDVLAVTSHQEGLHLAALEAMACGCPVVSTRCGGPEEYVFEHRTGALTAFDTGELASRLQEIVANRELRQELGANARDAVVSGYGWAQFRATLERELNSYLAAERFPSRARVELA